MDDWTKRNPSVAALKFIQSEFLADSPNRQRIEKIKEENAKKARTKVGLYPCTTDIKSIKAPSLNYIENPQNKTRAEYLDQLKKQMKDMAKFGYNEHKDAVERLKLKEDAVTNKNNRIAT